jgi:hypothetical protein
MPQLDIDLFEDFMFFAFIALLFGFGDEESEESLVELATDSFLAQFYIATTKKLIVEKSLIKGLVVSSIINKN